MGAVKKAGSAVGGGLGAVTGFAGGVAGGALGGLFGGLGGERPGAPGRAGYDPARQKLIEDRIKALRGELAGVPKPQMIGPEGAAYKAQPNQPQYSAVREAITNRAAASGRTANDAVTRRFAAMGGLGSGSAIKATQMVNDQAEAGKRAELAAVDQQIAQTESDKEFQSAEAAKGRGMQREVFNADQAFKDAVFRFDSNSKLAQLQLAFEQADRDSQDTEFSKELAMYQQKNSGGLFGSGGFLGLGF